MKSRIVVLIVGGVGQKTRGAELVVLWFTWRLRFSTCYCTPSRVVSALMRAGSRTWVIKVILYDSRLIWMLDIVFELPDDASKKPNKKCSGHHVEAIKTIRPMR